MSDTTVSQRPTAKQLFSGRTILMPSLVCTSLLLSGLIDGMLRFKAFEKDCCYAYKILLDNVLNFTFMPKHGFKATKTTELKPLKPKPV